MAHQDFKPIQRLNQIDTNLRAMFQHYTRTTKNKKKPSTAWYTNLKNKIDSYNAIASALPSGTRPASTKTSGKSNNSPRPPP